MFCAVLLNTRRENSEKILEGTVGTFNFTWHVLAFLFIASYVVPIR